MRYTYRLITIGVVLLAIRGFGVGPGFAQKTYLIRLGHNNAVTHPVHLAAMEFAEGVAERSEGRLKIEIYPSGQLGDTRVLSEGVRLGTVDMCWGVASFWGELEPAFYALEAGYLFKDRGHMEKVTRGEIGKELGTKRLPLRGVRILAYNYAGQRHLTNNKRPVHGPKDMKGLKIRTPEADSNIVTVQAMGATATPIPFQEVYVALQQGVADGQENPIPSIYAMKFHEVQRYLSLTGHIISVGLYAINEITYQRLPEDLKKVLTDSAQHAADNLGNLYATQERDLLSILGQSGVTIIQPDNEAFRTHALSKLDPWFQKMLGKDLYKAIKKIAD